MEKLRLKVCGMRDPANIREVIRLAPDYIGFIFYPGSPRFAGEQLQQEALSAIPAATKKTGVFVDAPLGWVARVAESNRLDMIQLHGDESPPFCANLRRRGFGIIKSLRVDPKFDFGRLRLYQGVIDYFLFDTAGALQGGTGRTFDWQVLGEYSVNTPFFLSGGISLENVGQASAIRSPWFFGIDVNSRFEISPGLKDIEKLEALTQKIKRIKNPES